MTVRELIERLKTLQPDATVVMCMDWTKLDFPELGQWEEELGDIATAGPTAKNIYLLNKSFK